MIFNSVFFELLRACQFKCKYCYERGFRNNSKRKITFEECRRVVDMMLEKSDFIQVSFGGGEPLILFKQVIKPLTEYCATLKGKEVNININTNGQFLHTETLQFCKDHSVKLSVSLDGPKHMHDVNRIFIKDGKGTYDSIIGRINEMIEMDLPLTVCQATYNIDTVQYLYESYLMAKSLRFKDWYAAPDIFNCVWEKKHFQILQEQYSHICDDYFSTPRVMGVSNLDNCSMGNPRFKIKSKTLIVEVNGNIRVGRQNATLITPELDTHWYIGHLDEELINQDRLDAFIEKFGEDANMYFYAKPSILCKHCPVSYCYKGDNPLLQEICQYQPPIQCYQKRLLAQQIKEKKELYGISE